MIQIYPGELIGKTITILTAADSNLVGKQVKVIDESKNSLMVAISKDKIKRILKPSITFRLDETGAVLSGREIAKRSEDRLKGK